MSSLDPAAPPFIPVVYRDEHLVVVSKPSGMLVHKAERAPQETVVLLQTLKQQLGQWLWPIQRLDRATSGLIAFALRKEVAAPLQRALGAESCRKEYYVLSRGAPPRRFASERPLQDDQGRPQPARTEFMTLRYFRGCALVRARIYTGRSNQIRRHLNHLAHHALGDTTFGKGRLNQLFRERYGLPRLFLHATRMCFDHPVLANRLCLRDRLPPDLRQTVLRLDPPQVAPPHG